MINQQYTPQAPKNYLKIITIIHLALFAGVLLFSIVAFTITPQKGMMFDTSDVFVIVVPFMALVAIAGSIFLYKQLVNAAIAKPTLKEKLMAYQGAFVARFALLEGVSLFSVFVYLITGNLFYLLIIIPLLVLFLILRPTKDRVFTDLNLTYDEQTDFNSSN